MAKKEESLIHLRFGYSEAMNAKKDILSSQLNVLKIVQSINNYKKLKEEELKKNEKISLKIKSAKSDLTKLHRLLPKLKIPKILEKKEEKIKTDIEEKQTKVTRYGTVEDQLRQIQEKLKNLENSKL